MNADGAAWGIVLQHEEEADPVDVSATDPSGVVLKIQVVRIPNEKRWERLSKTGAI